ncbi:MAG: hypothetical protein IT329_12470 [Caldilineaceae bacterium]|nr:hypothetical protein [Caldilineaceae bacterium]
MAQPWITESIRRQAASLLAQMTLEEKAALTIGRDFWTTRPIEKLVTRGVLPRETVDQLAAAVKA